MQTLQEKLVLLRGENTEVLKDKEVREYIEQNPREYMSLVSLKKEALNIALGQAELNFTKTANGALCEQTERVIMALATVITRIQTRTEPEEIQIYQKQKAHLQKKLDRLILEIHEVLQAVEIPNDSRVLNCLESANRLQNAQLREKWIEQIEIAEKKERFFELPNRKIMDDLVREVNKYINEGKLTYEKYDKILQDMDLKNLGVEGNGRATENFYLSENEFNKLVPNQQQKQTQSEQSQVEPMAPVKASPVLERVRSLSRLTRRSRSDSTSLPETKSRSSSGAVSKAINPAIARVQEESPNLSRRSGIKIGKIIKTDVDLSQLDNAVQDMMNNPESAGQYLNKPESRRGSIPSTPEGTPTLQRTSSRGFNYREALSKYPDRIERMIFMGSKELLNAIKDSGLLDSRHLSEQKKEELRGIFNVVEALHELKNEDLKHEMIRRFFVDRDLNRLGDIKELVSQLNQYAHLKHDDYLDNLRTFDLGYLFSLPEKAFPKEGFTLNTFVYNDPIENLIHDLTKVYPLREGSLESDMMALERKIERDQSRNYNIEEIFSSIENKMLAAKLIRQFNENKGDLPLPLKEKIIRLKDAINHYLKVEKCLTHKAFAYILNNTSPDISRMFNAVQLFQNKKPYDRETPAPVPLIPNPKTSPKAQ